MTVAFGNAGEVHWPNGPAFRVLAAMEIPTDGCAGSATIEEMKAGIERARKKTLTGDDLDLLEELATLVEEYEIGGEPVLEWR